MDNELCKRLDWMYSLINPVDRPVTMEDVERLREAFIELSVIYAEDFARYARETAQMEQTIIQL